MVPGICTKVSYVQGKYHTSDYFQKVLGLHPAVLRVYCWICIQESLMECQESNSTWSYARPYPLSITPALLLELSGPSLMALKTTVVRQENDSRSWSTWSACRRPGFNLWHYTASWIPPVTPANFQDWPQQNKAKQTSIVIERTMQKPPRWSELGLRTSLRL